MCVCAQRNQVPLTPCILRKFIGWPYVMYCCCVYVSAIPSILSASEFVPIQDSLSKSFPSGIFVIHKAHFPFHCVAQPPVHAPGGCIWAPPLPLIPCVGTQGFGDGRALQFENILPNTDSSYLNPDVYQGRRRSARLPPHSLLSRGSGRVRFSPQASWVRLAQSSKEQQISIATIINIGLLHLLCEFSVHGLCCLRQLEPLAGLEPATPGLQTPALYQLSYSGIDPTSGAAGRLPPPLPLR